MISIDSRMPGSRLDVLHGLMPPWQRPIVRAVRDAGCCWTTLLQEPGRFVLPCDRPQILLVGDDYGTNGSMGPVAFHARSIRRFVVRCGMAVVVPNDPDPALYAAAASAAAGQRCDVILIETRRPHEGDWVRFVRSVRPTMRMLIGTAVAREHVP